MSYETLSKAFVDPDLINRVRAAIAKEAFANAQYKQTVTGKTIATNGPDVVLPRFLWAVCIANEAAYESALAGGVDEPGKNPGVITDGAIGSAIQANWPTDDTIPPKQIYLKVVESGVIP